MKRLLSIALLSTSWIISPIFAAEAGPMAGPGRQCNLQGREIALRISEEVNSRISTEDRGQIAVIAEEVCMDYAANRGMRGQAGTSLREGAADDSEAEVENEDEGILGGLRVIDPEDRVKRPGLKRR